MLVGVYLLLSFFLKSFLKIVVCVRGSLCNIMLTEQISIVTTVASHPWWFLPELEGPGLGCEIDVCQNETLFKWISHIVVADIQIERLRKRLGILLRRLSDMSRQRIPRPPCRDAQSSGRATTCARHKTIQSLNNWNPWACLLTQPAKARSGLLGNR